MSPNDLTSLATLKAWLGVASSGDDDLLSGLITDISVAILSDLGRAAIRPTVYTETHDGGGETSILLRQWPVNEVLSLSLDGRPIAVTTSGSACWSDLALLDGSSPKPPGAMQRISIRHRLIPNGVQNVSIVYRSGYEVSGEPAIVPASPPYTIVAATPYGPWQSDGGVSYATGAALQAGSPPAAGAYAVTAGTYTFAAQDAGAAIVLRYGYIPADLGRACCEWAADRYAARGRIGQSSKTLGGQETAAFIVKAMPDFVSRLLQPYRRVVAP